MQITGIDAYRKATEKPIKNGKWTYYYESGKIEKEEFYEVNLILKTIYYSEKGFKTSKIEYGLKEGWLLAGETKYYENGTIKSEDFDGYEGSYSAKYYENGQIELEDWGEGEIKTYYKNGQIKTITITDQGFTLNYKLIEEYSEIGKLTKEEIYLSSQLQKQFKDGISINGKVIFEKDYQLNPSKDVRAGYNVLHYTLELREEKEYYDSGELQYTSNYVDDLKQGEWKEYYKSGELKSTANYVNSKLQGEWKRYYDSGELESTENYVDGLAQGEYKYYWESGELNRTATYVDGLVQGEAKFYYESGELERTVNYVNSKLQGEAKFYYESGELKSTVNYVDGLKQGELISYYESGEKEYTVNYVDGVKQ